MDEAVIYTDGACSGNPGPGGWGVVLRYGNVVKELHGGDRATTNNRMELLAAISALEALSRPVSVQLYTDSKYVLDGITKWLPGWQRNGWKTASKQPVKNVDLWQRRVAAMAAHEVSWCPAASIELNHVDIESLATDSERYRVSILRGNTLRMLGKAEAALPFLERGLDLAHEMHDETRSLHREHQRHHHAAALLAGKLAHQGGADRIVAADA